MKNLTVLLLLTIFTLPSFAKAGELGKIEDYFKTDTTMAYLGDGRKVAVENYSLDVKRIFMDAIGEEIAAQLFVDLFNNGDHLFRLGDAVPALSTYNDKMNEIHNTAIAIREKRLKAASNYASVSTAITLSPDAGLLIEAHINEAMNSIGAE